MRISVGLASCVLLASTQVLRGDDLKWTLTNHAGDYADELVRLKIAPPGPLDPAKMTVLEDGKPVPFQVETLDDGKTAIWVCTTIASKASHDYEVKLGQAPPAAAPRVTLKEEGDHHVLDNGIVAVKVPARAAAGQLVGPIAGIRIAGGAWLGSSSWGFQTNEVWKLAKFESTVVGAGPLFAKVRLRYEFDATTRRSAHPYFAQITARLAPGQPCAIIEESHNLFETAWWGFDTHAGWKPSGGLIRGWQTGPFQGNEKLRDIEMKPAERLGNTLALLQPRWTQGFDQAWFFAAADAQQIVGAIVGRAGKWDWPYDNLIQVRVKESGDAATLTCPAWRGGRWWMLLAGPRALADDAARIVTRIAMQPLDKLTNQYILDWPGQPPGGFAGNFFYDAGQTNPTGGVRGKGRGMVQSALGGKLKGDRSLLSSFQVYLDPDWYGLYYNHWGPINPNFGTDFLRVPIAMAAGLKAHPRFEVFRKMAEDAFRMDLDHSVTLPGGAGQECPGYTGHAMESWLQLADVCKQHLGFDPRQWPRYKAAGSFLLHTSQPLGGGKRRMLPLGDTHPPGGDVFEIARKCGIDDRIEDMKTEELPGFGVVFRSHSGGDKENFLAFKSGPNRGHNHGDQLSFHYCGDGRRLAIDHMCSYAPRADQEHMHNRVAFSGGGFDYANMDGYERLIAFKTSPAIDVAVGQVQSPRIRQQPRTPQETKWDAKGPYLPIEGGLTYRRTIAFIKGGRGLDYFVIRDQSWSGTDLTATYGLHVESDKCERRGSSVDLGKMTLLVAHPRDVQFERLDWSYSKGRGGFGESTSGARLSVTGKKHEFITVLYPSAKPPAMESIANGQRLTFDGGVDEVTFGELADAGTGAALVTLVRDGRPTVALIDRDVDLNRFQGEVGLFVPECGYDFGPIPQWLIQQRSTINARANWPGQR